MAIIVDGRKIASAIINELKPRVRAVKKNGATVALAVVLVGRDKPSQKYIKMKQKSAQIIGADFFKFIFPAGISKKALMKKIQQIQEQRDLSGLIIQLPLPNKFKSFTQRILDQINPKLDVDCLTTAAQENIKRSRAKMYPPTPLAILEVLQRYRITVKNKNILIIGRGQLVGRPLNAMLNSLSAKVTMVGRDCTNLTALTGQADIIVCGVGKKNLLRGRMIKNQAVVIDAGTCAEKGKLCGDVDFASVAKKARLITPVPGGVGPITVAKLLSNTVLAEEIKKRPV